MPRTLTTPDRVMLLLSLVPYLREYGPTTIAELSARFDADPKLVRRLVRFLGVAGIPGETRTYQHEDLFDIDWDLLERSDTVALTHVVAIDDTPRFSATEISVLIAGLQSLKSMLPTEHQAAIGSALSKLAQIQPSSDVAGPISVTPDARPPEFALFLEAIESRRRVRFTYQDASGRTTIRAIAPRELWQAGEEWYVRGHCFDRGADRTFLLERARGVQLQESVQDTVPGETRPRNASFLTDSPSLFPARFALPKRLLHLIAEFEPKLISEQDGRSEVEIELMHPDVAIRVVQAAPAHIDALSPDSVRRSVLGWIERSLAPYGT